MFYPFLVADSRYRLHYRLSEKRLAELSLAPIAPAWEPGPVIAASPDPIWAGSFANAPLETIAVVTAGLEALVAATPDLRPPTIDSLPDSRARRHLSALIRLWRAMGDALPPGLAAARHVLELPQGRFLDPLPVVAGSVDPLAPPAMQALHERLKTEFGAQAAPVQNKAATAGSRLHALQDGLRNKALETGPLDDSLAFFGLRDGAACAEFAAARARALIENGVQPREIAIMAAGHSPHLAHACAAQGIPLSGLPDRPPQRDLIGETALLLALAKRSPTPAMVLAGLALSPLMPWTSEAGRDLAESVMAGDFRVGGLGADAEHLALWEDVRASASSLQQFRFYMDRICPRLRDGDAVRARLPIPLDEGTVDWETLLRNLQLLPPSCGDAVRNLEGVSLWTAHESPWRTCRHLIVTDFTEGLYPARPQANPLFLDSELAAIREATGLDLRGRADALRHSLALLDAQIRAVSESITFLVPWRDFAGTRLAPSAGLSLVARAIGDIDDPADLVTDLTHVAPGDWPVAHHRLAPPSQPPAVPDFLAFPDHELLALRRDDDGKARPQSPSRLETLLVSPLAWFLDEIGATDMTWSPEGLDIITKGTIAHDVFEHVFKAGEALPDRSALSRTVHEACDRALGRHAIFLRSAAWEMERNGLEREILQAAGRWHEQLLALDARIIGNEMWLAGKAHGIRLRGKADTVLELPDRMVLIVDHKKSGTANRRKRMEAEWDLQAGLYRSMLARPIRRDGDGLDRLIGRQVAIAYHLMNDGGLLTSGLEVTNGSPARDMGKAIDREAVAHLKTRLADLKAGRLPLNTTADEAFFKREGGFTPYALTDGSPLVRAFMKPVEGQ